MMCYVEQGSKELATFFIKNHLGIVRSGNHNLVDLRELYAYKVLEHIKVGPTVHFLPNEHYSQYALYIATEQGKYSNFFIFI